MEKIFKRLTGIFLTVFFLAVVLAGTAYARYEFNPQYKNKGTIGTATKPWEEGGFRDLNITRNLDFCGSDDATVEGSGVSRLYTRVYKVTSYLQLSLTESGDSVFVVDPALYKTSIYEIDATAIYNSSLPTTSTGLTGWGLTGLTVASITPTAANDGYEYSITKPDSSTTPLYVWQPTESNSGTTSTGTLRAFDPDGAWHTGTSTFRVDAQGDIQSFRLQHDSEISIQQKSELIGG